MENRKTRENLVRKIIASEESQKKLEELVDILLEEKFTFNFMINEEKKESFGERLSDKFAHFTGSWTFIFLFLALLISWILINTVILDRSYDPFPFILLNLILSCISSIQAPIIMMSQNRHAKKEHIRSENEYRINLKAEVMLEDIHLILEDIRRHLENADKE